MTDAEKMAEGLNFIGPHEFRDGKVLAFIDQFSANGDMLSIEYVMASYENIAIEVECPMNWAGYKLLEGQDPLELAYMLVSAKIREYVNAQL